MLACGFSAFISLWNPLDATGEEWKYLTDAIDGSSIYYGRESIERVSKDTVRVRLKSSRTSRFQHLIGEDRLF